LQAFWTLSTERQSSAGSIGQIPWSAAMRYGSFRGIEVSMLPAFWQVVSMMDGGFLEWMRSEHDRHVRMSKPSKGAGGRTKTTKG